MPFTERLTWDGVALHAGAVPGYPSSHGCVHLPLDFAQLLFGVTEVGTTVVIADAHGRRRTLVHPGLLADPRASSTAGRRRDRLGAGSGRHPGRSSLLVSIADRRCYVYRNGIEIGQAAVSFARPQEPLRPAVFVILDQDRRPTGPVWSEVGLFASRGPEQRSDVLERLSLPHGLRCGAAASAPRPGTSLYCALGSATADTQHGQRLHHRVGTRRREHRVEADEHPAGRSGRCRTRGRPDRGTERAPARADRPRHRRGRASRRLRRRGRSSRSCSPSSTASPPATRCSIRAGRPKSASAASTCTTSSSGPARGGTASVGR